MGGEFWGFAAGRDAFVPPDAESDGADKRLYTI
jgi:hypothetical protein